MTIYNYTTSNQQKSSVLFCFYEANQSLENIGVPFLPADMQAPISGAESIPAFHTAACSNPSDMLCCSEKRMCSLMPLITRGLFFDIDVANCMA
jgi:hypothetical protein